MQKLYWGAFALAVAFLVANRAREYYASLKSKEEMAAELAERPARHAGGGSTASPSPTPTTRSRGWSPGKSRRS